MKFFESLMTFEMESGLCQDTKPDCFVRKRYMNSIYQGFGGRALWGALKILISGVMNLKTYFAVKLSFKFHLIIPFCFASMKVVHIKIFFPK